MPAGSADGAESAGGAAGEGGAAVAAQGSSFLFKLVVDGWFDFSFDATQKAHGMTSIEDMARGLFLEAANTAVQSMNLNEEGAVLSFHVLWAFLTKINNDVELHLGLSGGGSEGRKTQALFILHSTLGEALSAMQAACAPCSSPLSDGLPRASMAPHVPFAVNAIGPLVRLLLWLVDHSRMEEQAGAEVVASLRLLIANVDSSTLYLTHQLEMQKALFACFRQHMALGEQSPVYLTLLKEKQHAQKTCLQQTARLEMASRKMRRMEKLIEDREATITMQQAEAEQQKIESEHLQKKLKRSKEDRKSATALHKAEVLHLKEQIKRMEASLETYRKIDETGAQDFKWEDDEDQAWCPESSAGLG